MTPTPHKRPAALAMQCKDIPDRPVLEFLDGFPRGNYSTATWFDAASGELFENSVQHGMPPGVPRKLALAKMRGLIKRGLVDGCCCGCLGDFSLTPKGIAALAAMEK